MPSVWTFFSRPHLNRPKVSGAPISTPGQEAPLANKNIRSRLPLRSGAVAQPSGEQNGIPFFAKKGWTRPKENGAKHPLGADGVVVSSYRLFIPNGLIIGGLKQLPRLR